MQMQAKDTEKFVLEKSTAAVRRGCEIIYVHDLTSEMQLRCVESKKRCVVRNQRDDLLNLNSLLASLSQLDAKFAA